MTPFKTYAVALCAALTALTAASAQAQTQDEWRLSMAGDIMLGSDYPTVQLPPDEGRGLLEAATPGIAWADIALGNLEGTLTTGGVSSKQGCGQCYAFRSPPQFAARLAEAGFDGMSQANGFW